MPTITFNESEIEEDLTATVNNAGLAYAGRKHKGRKVRIIVLKDVK